MFDDSRCNKVAKMWYTLTLCKFKSEKSVLGLPTTLLCCENNMQTIYYHYRDGFFITEDNTHPETIQRNSSKGPDNV